MEAPQDTELPKFALRENDQVEAAWPYVSSSYDTMGRRMDVVAGRIQQLTTVVTAAVFGAFTLTAQVVGRPDLHSPWIVASLALAAVALVVGWFALFRCNELTVIDPAKLYQDQLSAFPDERTFKLAMIFFAGEHFTVNRRRVAQMWLASIVMTLLLVASLVMLAVWAYQQLSDVRAPVLQVVALVLGR